MRYTRYISSSEALILNYKGGKLVNVISLTNDKVAFDALRHYIELFESDIDLRFFKIYEGPV